MRRLNARVAYLAVVALVGTSLPAAAQGTPFILDTLRVSVDSRLTSGTGTVEVLDAAALAALPVRTVAEALGWMLGVDLQPRSPAQADLSIRGSTFEQVVVLVDGVRMSDPQTGHFDLDLAIPLDRVERVEVLRGPGSALHGSDAVGGVVHIITKDGRNVSGPAGATRFYGGSQKTAGGALDASIPAGDWRISGGISRDQSDGHREGTDYRTTLGSARMSGPAGAGRLVLDVGHARRDFGAADFYAPFPSYEETRTTTTAARWVGRLSPSVALEPRISYRRHEDDFTLRRGDPDFYRNLHDSRQLTGELQARMPLGPTGALALGGEWSRETLESTNLGDREQEWRAAYGEMAFRKDGVQLQGGVRWEDRQDVGDVMSPTASVRWDGRRGLAMRASWGRTFRAPTWTERYYQDPANVGNPDLGVERGWSAEGAMEFRGAGVSASATAFRRVTDGLIDWARPDGSDGSVPWETRNVTRATTDGVELSAGGTLASGVRLEASAAWLSLEAVDEEGYFSKYALRPLHRVLMVRGILPLPDESSLTVAAADRARLGGGGGITMDLRLDFPVGHARGFLDLWNATDEAYPDVSGLPVPGRAWSLGVRTPFGGRPGSPIR